MRLMIHTLRKDLRRLWPAILVACIMLFLLARMDRWRSDWMAGSSEGWLTMLVTMAWACLAALAVLEEPLVGDRNFWTTRPHNWLSLLAAKVVFVAVAIHVPSFLADVYILGSRGFAPFSYLPELLSKQCVILAAITFPAIAIASLVRTFTHFVIAAFVVATLLLFLNGGFQAIPEFIPLRYHLHYTLVRILLVFASAAILWMQYAQRRMIPARTLAVIAALGCAALVTWLPARAEYSVAATSAPPRITLRDAPPLVEQYQQTPQVVTSIDLPVAAEGVPSGDQYRVPLVELTVTLPDGSEIHSARRSPNHPYEKIDLTAFYTPSIAHWLDLHFSQAAWQRVRNARVRISGDIAFEFYRLAPSYGLTAPGEAAFPGLGRCTTIPVEQNYNSGAVKVECESPREAPRGMVRPADFLYLPKIAVRFGTFNGIESGPHYTWLSPLQRTEVYFPLNRLAVLSNMGDAHITVANLPATRFVITPEISTGHALAHFQFDDVSIQKWTPQLPH